MIATLNELKTYLGISGTSQDTILNILIDSANSFVETYIGRKIESDDYEEYKDGNAQRFILLDNYPVNSIDKFQLNKGTLDEEEREDIEPSTYKVSPKIGKIFLRFYLKRGFQNYKILYNAGYETIPGDLKLATLKLASGYYNKRTSDGIKSESVAGDSIGFDTTEISNDVLVILNNYRDV